MSPDRRIRIGGALLVAVMMAASSLLLATSAAQANEALYVKGTLRMLQFGNVNPGPTTASYCSAVLSVYPVRVPAERAH